MRISVLLIEFPDGSDAYADALHRAGFQVDLVADAAEAFDAVLARAPHVIVASFDSALRASRFALCEQLQADERTRSIPLVLTAAALDRDDIEQATSVGVLALALPPSNEAKLVSAIQGVLAAHRKRPPARATLGRRSKDDSARSA
jgi:CheY-like chemotaxis protein